jgi:DNA-binding PadR family transcriptional regulator
MDQQCPQCNKKFRLLNLTDCGEMINYPTTDQATFCPHCGVLLSSWAAWIGKVVFIIRSEEEQEEIERNRPPKSTGVFLMRKFKGFESSKQNWSKLPHQLIEALPNIKTIGEMKVIIYTLRHTWGYQDDYKKITLDEFENGRKRKDGSRIDNGTGLTKPTIVDGIKRAVADGFLFEHVDLSDTARVKKFYSLTQEGLKDLTPGVKNFNTRGKDSLHRTEKETVKKETLENGSAKNSQNQNGEDGFDRANQTERDNLNALADRIAEISKTDIETIGPKTREALKALTLAIYKKPNNDAKLTAYEKWWYANDWRGKQGQPPTVFHIGDTWGQFEADKVAPPTTAGPPLSDEAMENYKRLLAQTK